MEQSSLIPKWPEPVLSLGDRILRTSQLYKRIQDNIGNVHELLKPIWDAFRKTLTTSDLSLAVWELFHEASDTDSPIIIPTASDSGNERSTRKPNSSIGDGNLSSSTNATNYGNLRESNSKKMTDRDDSDPINSKNSSSTEDAKNTDHKQVLKILSMGRVLINIEPIVEENILRAFQADIRNGTSFCYKESSRRRSKQFPHGVFEFSVIDKALFKCARTLANFKSAFTSMYFRISAI